MLAYRFILFSGSRFPELELFTALLPCSGVFLSVGPRSRGSSSGNLLVRGVASARASALADGSL